MRHLLMEPHNYLCQLVAADVQQCKGFQILQGYAHLGDSILMEIQDRKIVHPLKVCWCYLSNSTNNFTPLVYC